MLSGGLHEGGRGEKDDGGMDLIGGGVWRTDAMTGEERGVGVLADGVSWTGPGSGGESGGSGWCPISAKKRFDVGIIFLAGPNSLTTLASN